eukprot:gene7671-12137_t
MNFLLQLTPNPAEHFISQCYYSFPSWAINRVHPKNTWRLIALGIALGFGLLFYLLSFLAFVFNIRTPQIKDRAPFLLLISAFAGLSALLYMFLRNFFDIVLVCPITYYILLIMIVLFFLPYLLRSVRTIVAWDFNKNNAARVENRRGAKKTDESKKVTTQTTTTTATTSATTSNAPKEETGEEKQEVAEQTESSVETKEETKEQAKEEFVQVEIKEEKTAEEIKKEKDERAKFLQTQKKIKFLLKEWVLIAFLCGAMLIWLILGASAHGILVGIGYIAFQRFGILDPSCQKQCNLHEGWALRIFVFILAFMIIIYIGLVVRMYNINDSFSIRNELAVLCIFSIFCVIGMFILMSSGYEFWWPRNPYIGYILAVQIVGAYVISLLYPLFLAVYNRITKFIDEKHLLDKLLKKGDGASGKSGKQQITFEYILENANAREKFKQFLVREFSVENLMFYTEVVYLATLDDKDDIEDTADSINDTYVQEGAPFQISISSDLRKKCNDAINGDSDNIAEPFNEAKVMVETIMKEQSYPRFIKSKLFKELSAEINPKKK